MGTNKSIIASICGIDGSGKSSLITEVNKIISPQHSSMIIRCPQYFLDPNLPFYFLSSKLEKIGKLADAHKSPIIKTNATFLAFSLQGHIIEFVKRTYGPQIILCERNSIIDAITYATFYLPLLANPAQELTSAQRDLDAKLKKELAHFDFSDIHNWCTHLFGKNVDLFNLHQKIIQTFKGDAKTVFNNLSIIFSNQLPDLVAVLLCSPEALKIRHLSEQRMEKEIHEDLPILLSLQSTLQQVCQKLSTTHQLIVEEFVTSSTNLEDSAQKLALKFINKLRQ
ncbi:MAG: hypothetical protein A2504_07985 [Bdellovibrionales bacterium RIFOXYD12_FULL_39_22]|nr:MAG: hypothetical protein A2385_13610 [Bdellovibrionales bacterium RIFOXYB1_FULL_39_21]OFZ44870.1 MAG: hypothetical protein A2485_14820 [Bdellovibrionales bacterium RIFOXYC12_FULL_39_17]OFZ49388.1 MAG: hypothetical protein A2404_09155 [Bdellovibrionales bacterium RIFOXYC1_FULL_39_130]OFZ77109.1 MAG: hypothetical protein A2560_10805 [Bdellovibrionales bacterium RIFOXYD1_FULL_39_84]OFZ95570.1 MAG: hypothetical protein A2504_07985 [Bdellovibrionales bacterium RIFOXYD12_FULL_39_22]